VTPVPTNEGADHEIEAELKVTESTTTFCGGLGKSPIAHNWLPEEPSSAQKMSRPFNETKFLALSHLQREMA